MDFTIVPADFAWLSDVGLKGALMANIKARIEDSVRKAGQGRATVTDLGGSVLVEIEAGKDVAHEKGARPHQMTQLENKTIPVKDSTGKVHFRRASSLSIMLGKFRHPGIQKKETVKNAVSQALAESAEDVVKTKDQLEAANPPLRLRDVVGLRKGRMP